MALPHEFVFNYFLLSLRISPDNLKFPIPSKFDMLALSYSWQHQAFLIQTPPSQASNNVATLVFFRPAQNPPIQIPPRLLSLSIFLGHPNKSRNIAGGLTFISSASGLSPSIGYRPPSDPHHHSLTFRFLFP